MLALRKSVMLHRLSCEERGIQFCGETEAVEFSTLDPMALDIVGT